MTAQLPDLIVNGEKVPSALIAAEAQHHQAPRGEPGIAWRKAANALAVRTLLLQEARRRGVKAAPAQVGPGRFETEEEALVRGLLETALDAATPTEAEIRAEWARNPDRFRSPPLWDVSHILIACDPRDAAAKEKALSRAAALSERLRAAPENFARIATAESDCPSKEAGGALGQLRPGDVVPEFEAALRDLPAGEITPEPVPSRYGYHLIRMEARADGDVLPYETVRPKIAEALERAEWTRAARAFVGELVARADIQGADMAPDGAQGRSFP